MKNSLRKIETGRPDSSHSRGAPAPITTKRLNINLPKHVFDGLDTLAKSSGRTMTEVVRVALGLAAVALAEEENGHRLVIAKRNGDVIREIVLPK